MTQRAYLEALRLLRARRPLRVGLRPRSKRHAYRHDGIAEANLRRRPYIATTKVYNGLGNVILNEEHRTP